MKKIILIILTLLIVTACTPKSIALDDARQIAVNRIMTDDNYVQNDGYDFKELEAKTLDCEACYAFKYEYKIDKQYTDFDGYVVDVVMKNDQITSILFAEMQLESIENNTSIVDRFDYTCENKCGNGYCDEIVCQGSGCTCEETSQNCPEDC
jgi:hypothetical protein